MNPGRGGILRGWMTDKRRVGRDRFLCVLVFLGCVAVAWPVAQMPYNDDWSYIKTAQVFARTGHVAYNGWATAMLGWMIPWGALFIKLFGFSFMAVKLSTLPLAVVCLLLFHAILRRFAITPRNAVIGTLALGLSPLFLTLSATFMSDIPGLFVILLCLYCCQRAAQAASERAAILWLVVAAGTNIVGGTARQVAWLGVLVMVPCTGWLLRERRRVRWTAAGLWVVGFGAVLYCMHWFGRQPYSIMIGLLPKMPPSLYSALMHFLLMGVMFESLFILILVFLFPILVAWLSRFGTKMDHYLALFCAGLLPLGAVAIVLGRQSGIWPPLVLVEDLATRKHGSRGPFYDVHHLLVSMPLQIVISLIAIAALFGLLFALQDGGWEELRTSKPDIRRLLVWLLVPYSACYALLTLRLLWHGLSFDRYALGVMPCAIAGLIWIYQESFSRELPKASVMFLVVYAALGVAGTHNYFAWQRARLAAIHEVRRAGVPRTDIQAGFVHDGWTQVSLGGYVHNPAITYPPDAQRAHVGGLGLKDPCVDNYLLLTTVIRPQYEVGLAPLGCYLPSRFPAVRYTAWLPPFRREVRVGRVPKKYQ